MPLKTLSVRLRTGQENSITKNKNTYRAHTWRYQDLPEQVKFSTEATCFPEARPAISATLSFSTVPPNVTYICKIEDVLLSYMGKQTTYLIVSSIRIPFGIGYSTTLFTLAVYGPWLFIRDLF